MLSPGADSDICSRIRAQHVMTWGSQATMRDFPWRRGAPGIMPLVSIVMNVWNGAETLEAAIESVLAQTFTDWELIVWDDQSTDSSAQAVRRFQDPRIRYFLAPLHTPLGEARNLAIRQAQGRWVAFLDQDDLWLPRKLELQCALGERDPAVDLVYGRTVAFRADGREWDYDHRHEFGPLPEGDIFRELFACSCFISMSSAMIRTEALRRAGEIPPAVRVIADYYVFAAVARQGKAAAVQQVVCRYRVHSDSMSKAQWERMHEEALELIEHWRPHLEPALAEYRKQVHSTVLGLCRMRIPGSRRSGLWFLLSRGSLAYLLSRPFAIGYRTLKRHLVRGRGAAP